MVTAARQNTTKLVTHSLPLIEKSALYFVFSVVDVPNNIHLRVVLYLFHDRLKSNRRLERFRSSRLFPSCNDQQLQHVGTGEEQVVVVVGKRASAPKLGQSDEVSDSGILEVFYIIDLKPTKTGGIVASVGNILNHFFVEFLPFCV